MSRYSQQQQEERNFFKLQVGHRSIKRLTKEILERRNELHQLEEKLKKAKENKADKSTLNRAKDEVNLSTRAIKVASAALGKAIGEVETHIRMSYVEEFDVIKSEKKDPSITQTKNEVCNEIRELVDSLVAMLEVCPEHKTLAEYLLKDAMEVKENQIDGRNLPSSTQPDVEENIEEKQRVEDNEEY